MMLLATFFTHYGAMKFHKQCKDVGIVSKMMPVPRSLSSSCGVCVQFEAQSPPEGDLYDLENYYIVKNDGGYEKWTTQAN